jgi:hypothetical protein
VQAKSQNTRNSNMERSELCIPRDFEPRSIGQIALRKWIDEIIDETQRGAFEVMTNLMELQDE